MTNPKGIHIGEMSLADMTWQAGVESSIDIVGRLRMRNSSDGTIGNIMTDADGTGTLSYNWQKP